MLSFSRRRVQGRVQSRLRVTLVSRGCGCSVSGRAPKKGQICGGIGCLIDQKEKRLPPVCASHRSVAIDTSTLERTAHTLNCLINRTLEPQQAPRFQSDWCVCCAAVPVALLSIVEGTHPVCVTDQGSFFNIATAVGTHLSAPSSSRASAHCIEPQINVLRMCLCG